MRTYYLKFLKTLISKVKHPIYPYLLFFLGAIDHFILLIPIDFLTGGSVILDPKAWKKKAVAAGLGTSLGAFLFAMVIRHYGVSAFALQFPQIVHSEFWAWCLKFIENWGGVGLFIMMAGPLMQQPALCLVAIGPLSLTTIGLIILAGKFLKYFIITYTASKFPHLLHKLKFISGDLDDIATLIENDGDGKNPRLKE